MSKHTASQTPASIVHDLGYGIRENFTYRDRNGKHRHINAFTAVNDALRVA